MRWRDRPASPSRLLHRFVYLTGSSISLARLFHRLGLDGDAVLENTGRADPFVGDAADAIGELAALAVRLALGAVLIAAGIRIAAWCRELNEGTVPEPVPSQPQMHLAATVVIFGNARTGEVPRAPTQAAQMAIASGTDFWRSIAASSMKTAFQSSPGPW